MKNTFYAELDLYFILLGNLMRPQTSETIAYIARHRETKLHYGYIYFYVNYIKRFI